LSRYAQGSSVTIDRSKGEIERTLMRFGADQYMAGQSQLMAFIMFVYRGRTIRISFDIPRRDDFSTTETGRRRSSQKVQQDAFEAALREQWRALLLMVKGQARGL